MRSGWSAQCFSWSYKSWNSQGFGLHNLCLTEPLLFQSMPLTLIFLLCITEAWSLLLRGGARISIESSQSCLLPSLNKSYCLSLSLKGECSSFWSSWWFPCCTYFIWSIFLFSEPKTGLNILYHGNMCRVKRKNALPSPTGCSPVAVMQDAGG